MSEFIPYREVDHDFFDTANLRSTNSITVRCTPGRVMEMLSGDDVWTQWAAALEKVEWAGPPPFGVGSRRTVHLKGGEQVKEVFFAWEDEKRVSFYVEEGTLANVSVFAEDYIIEQIDTDHTRLTWTIALQLTGFMRFLAPLQALLMKLVLTGWLKKFRIILEQATPPLETAITQDQAP